MERPITQGELEASMVRSCAPTLLGAKPASMFTFCGTFATRCPDCEEEGCSKVPPGTVDAACARRRAALTRLLSEIDAVLAGTGVRATVLAWRPFGAIIYVYRPGLLARYLRDKRCATDLAAMGYRVASDAADDVALRLLLAHLRERFRNVSVPHEVGYFLGYPVEDVRGFIAHKGADFICCGCWKVYADARRAQRLFARYKRCTRHALSAAALGASLVDIARLPVLARAA